jgi:capsular exopolysaccharide synthesis family protein
VGSLDSLSVLDHARSATQSPFAGLRFKLTLGLILGLLGGLGVAFFLEYLDNSLKTPEAAERLLGVPALVAIPRHNPPFDEAYRMLRINLASRERGADGADAIMLTAAKPRAGTSTVTANLARAFAQAGRRTIVVDAALAGPAQHRIFKVPNERGLLQLLDGQAELDDVLMPAARNLWVVPAGAESAEVSGALLGSPSMEAALRALRQRGDIVLLDTSAAGAFADPFDVAPQTSGVVLVLDANQAPRGAEEQIKLQFDRLRAPVLGAVLTKVAPATVDSYFYQERFYRTPPRRSFVPAAASVVVVLAAAALCVHLATSPSKASRPATQLQQVRGTVDAAVRAVQHTALSGHPVNTANTRR